MKKAVLFTIAILGLFVVSGAFAQAGTSAASGSSVSRSHKVRVTVPTVIVLRINGTDDAVLGQPVIEFDYGTSGAAYLNAVQNATPLANSSSSMTSVEVFTNDPDGYTVTVAASEDTALNGLSTADIMFKGSSLGTDATVTTSTANGAGGFDVIAQASDFTLSVDGDEGQGMAVYTITYTAAAN